MSAACRVGCDRSGRRTEGVPHSTSHVDHNAEAIDILIADDHPILRDGLRLLFDTEPGFRVVGEAGDGEQAVNLVRQLNPDILLLDLRMPRCSGLETLRKLAMLSNSVRTIILAAEVETAELVEAIQLGARGMILKQSTTEVLFECIRSVMAGQYWIGKEKVSDVAHALHSLLPSPTNGSARIGFGLTPREMEILLTIVAGYTNKDIAQKLAIAEHTVKHHITNIFNKVGVFNRLELVLFAVEHGMVAR